MSGTLHLGQRAELTRSYTAGDLAEFAALAGTAPGEAVPEPLLGALFSYLLGVELPGPGTNYLKQDFAFPAPAPLDTALTASVEITRIRAEKQIVDLWASCTTPDGTVVCEGRALVKAADTGRLPAGSAEG
ncbi:MAG: phosphate acetyltransferase [Silicimonas sp.]|jgi:acyl dehydratase|nr:phosphate acetyltransferase [Silicimonas sp.]